ncbi:hypothetical protein [Brevundimonas sp.]|uniref:hypothetical protein n=1 Tax=Brevundimonas sp. TaxID=1871086 RepID=UPI0022C634BD|nr:hypothetical protein [Brevundimonas sp.]MCZ8193100.1 hypothetical protein [Brevundimonas sp.]
MPILMPPAELPPHYHDQIRAQAAAVIVIDVAAVEAGPARPGGYATCQVEGRVTAVERGGQHTAGQPIRLAVPCITPDWDPVPGPWPGFRIATLSRTASGRAWLDADGRLVQRGFDIVTQASGD